MPTWRSKNGRSPGPRPRTLHPAATSLQTTYSRSSTHSDYAERSCPSRGPHPPPHGRHNGDVRIRGRALFDPGPAARRDHLQGSPRRADDPAAGRVGHAAAGDVILDPDTAVQGALRRLFTTFEATGSASACVKAFNTDGLAFPWRHRACPRKGDLDWKPLAAPRRPARTAQPPLRRRVHFRPAPRPEAARRQDDHHQAAARGMDRVHPRRPPRIHHHGTVRGQPRTGWPPTPPRTALTAPPGHPAKAPRCCRASSSAAAAATG